MKGLENFLWFLYKCFAFYSLIVFALILWIPFDGWLAGFMMMSYPVVMAVHLISIPIWFLVRRKNALLPLGMVALGCIFLPRTFAFGNAEPEPVADQPGSFKVLSYNTHVFMRNSYSNDKHTRQQIQDMKRWIAECGAQILCMPEFYDEKLAAFNTGKYFNEQGFKYNIRFSDYKTHHAGEYWGMALYSKFPIISRRDTVFNAQNGMIQADIKVGTDTIRVISLHLYSMTLNLDRLAGQKQMDGALREGRFTFQRMKNGFKERARQIRNVESWAAASPYPVVICGDYNEIPYGYVYGKLRQNYVNAFEQKGSGFGFTYNQLPYFIRIDHQFFDDRKLRLIDFETHNTVKFSDHYPVSATYAIRSLEKEL